MSTWFPVVTLVVGYGLATLNDMRRERREDERDRRQREADFQRAQLLDLQQALQDLLTACGSHVMALVDGEMPTFAMGEAVQQSLSRCHVLRARIADKLGWLGGALDPVANAAGATLISSPGSRVALYVIPTDEELMIARHTLALLTAHHSH